MTDQHDAPDVTHRTVDSPIGPLLLAATGKGLVRVAFDVEDAESVLASLTEGFGLRVVEESRGTETLDTAENQLDEYFSGRRRGFDLPLDFSLSSGFRRTVQRHLPTIAFGDTRTYRQVAEAIGNPGAVRAVGTACATNPLPVVVPCHRVLRTDGGLGGYRGGLEAKTLLLELEGA